MYPFRIFNSYNQSINTANAFNWVIHRYYENNFNCIINRLDPPDFFWRGNSQIHLLNREIFSIWINNSEIHLTHQ